MVHLIGMILMKSARPEAIAGLNRKYYKKVAF